MIKKIKQFAKGNPLVKKSLLFIWNNVMKIRYGFLRYHRRERKQLSLFRKKNADKTFYILRSYEKSGLFGFAGWVLTGVEYALSKGWIPVVDFEHVPCPYREPDLIEGTYNAWEYFFEQPMNYTLADAKGSKNVVLGRELLSFDQCAISPGKEVPITLFNRYIRLNDSLMTYAKSRVTELFGRRNGKIIGIKYRGTDYLNAPPGHAVGQSLNEFILLVDKLLENEWGGFIQTVGFFLRQKLEKP